jgi:NitT/TauT family transport system substrate-binding protein
VIGTYADVHPNLCVAMYFTSTQLMTSNPELVRRFTEAMNESLSYAQANPNDVRAVLGTYTQISEPVRAELILPKFSPEVDRAAIQALGDISAEFGTLPKAPDLAALLP